MRDLNRNKRTLYYAPYLGETDIVDANGNLTGESEPAYGDITMLQVNVSASVGTEATEAFGGFMNYTRTITVSDRNCPLDEDSVVWFGADITGPHNYIVTRKADSKNGLLYALLEVKVGA